MMRGLKVHGSGWVFICAVEGTSPMMRGLKRPESGWRSCSPVVEGTSPMMRGLKR